MRRAVLAVLAVLAAIVAVLGGAGAAGAHGDEGVLEVVNAAPGPDGTSVTYTVELTYANDGDVVDGATVTATARRPGGGALAPVPLVGVGPGSYAGTVTFPSPGDWRVTFATAEPVAEVEATFTAEPAPATTVTTVAPTSVAPATTVAAELVADDSGGEGGGPPAALVLGAVVAGAVLIAAVVLGILRRRTADL